MHFATTQDTQQVDGFSLFFQQYGLLLLLLVLIVFMFWSSRRRMARQKAEQEDKAARMLPGAKVLLQGGLYGTIVEYDGEDLSKSARVELAPGMVVEVHSQAVLRIVDEDAQVASDDEPIAEEPVETNVSEQSDTVDGVADSDDKPKA